MMVKKKRVIIESDMGGITDVMFGVKSDVKTANQVRVMSETEIWKVICLTRAQHYGGAEYLMEIQQNDATKEIRAVKKEI